MSPRSFFSSDQCRHKVEISYPLIQIGEIYHLNHVRGFLSALAGHLKVYALILQNFEGIRMSSLPIDAEFCTNKKCIILYNDRVYFSSCGKRARFGNTWSRLKTFWHLQPFVKFTCGLYDVFRQLRQLYNSFWSSRQP